MKIFSISRGREGREGEREGVFNDEVAISLPHHTYIQTQLQTS